LLGGKRQEEGDKRVSHVWREESFYQQSFRVPFLDNINHFFKEDKMNTLIKSVFVIFCLSFCCLPCFAACPSADLTGDCRVDFNDFAKMAEQWLTEGTPTPILYGMTWVSINDSGAGMKDGDGNPISQGGFTGEMSKYETTNAQYCQFLNDALASGDITVYADNVVYATSDTSHSQPYFSTEAASSDSQITYSGTFSVRSRDGYSMANHPVVMVSWYGATAFCNYYGCRLPTEWEWQAVADFNGTYTYGCGTSIDSSKANYNMNNPLGLTSYPYTSPVGYYPAYGYEMCDMAGNVWEWTSSCYYDCSYGFRVFRGGSWYFDHSYCTVSYWYFGSPYGSNYNLGFRVCR
jgi:hypothetical protein